MAMRSVRAVIRLRVPAGKATPGPPVGTALGAYINVADFTRAFNADTANINDSVPMRVEVTAYDDRTFTYTQKLPATSYFLKLAAGVEKGASSPGHETVASVSAKQVYEIAKIKQADTPSVKLESLVKSIMGSARSMGIDVTWE